MAFSIEAQLKAVDRITKPISRVQRRIRRFTKASGADFKSLNRKAADFSKTVLKTGAVLGTGALSIGLVKAGENAVNFEQTLARASSKFGEAALKGTAGYDAMSKAARKAGAETEFSANQSMMAIDFLAMAGFSLEQSLSALTPVIDLATAANVELAEATDIASDVLGAMGLMSKDPERLYTNLIRVNDVLAKTVTTSNTTMQLMYETIKESGPIANKAKLSIETLAAMSGVLANSMIKGEKSGTTLKNILVSLSSQTPKAAAALKKLGVVTQDQSGNFRDIFDIFEDINQGIKKEALGTAEVTAIMADIFGKIPLAGINILLDAGSKELRRYREQLEKAGGSSKTMAAVIRDTTLNSINSLTSALESLGITVFKLNGGIFRNVIERMKEIVRNIDKWIQTNNKLSGQLVSDVLDTLLGLLKVVGLIIAAFTVWKLLTVGFIVTIALFNAGMIALKATLLIFKGILIALQVAQVALNIAMWLNPVVAVVAAIGLLVVAAALLMEYWDPISDFFINIWDSIKSAFSAGIDFVTSLLEPFWNTVSGIVSIFDKLNASVSIKEEKAENADAGNVSGIGVAGSARSVQIISSSSQQTVSRTERSQTELVIRDETGRAELSKPVKNQGVQIKMLRSG